MLRITLAGGVYGPGDLIAAMSAPTDKPMPDDAVRERAVEWHVRLASDEASEADWLAFEAWISEAPGHQRAYESVEALWSELDEASAEPAREPVVPFRPRPRRPAISRIEVWIGAVAASLILAVIVGLNLSGQPPLTTYQTPRGQRQVIALADGTHITLNGGSQLAVRLGRRDRQVFMADAEAVFDVAKDPSRPFLIQAGDRQVRVVGTEFNVLRRSGQVRVVVRRGIVEVRNVKTPAAQPIARLVAGQALAHREGVASDQVSAADPAEAFAWTEGRLVFHNERLADVAERLNPYLATPLVIAPDAQNLRVTAVLAIGPDAAMLQSLMDFLPLRAERDTKAVRLSLRSSGR